MMKSNNIPTVIDPIKQGNAQMNQDGDVEDKCTLCGGEDGLTHVGIFQKDAKPDDELDPRKILKLCEGHYTKLIENREYRVRELPEIEGEVAHSSREEVSEGHDDFIVILEPENENKWLKVPDDLELNLKDER